MPKTKEQKEAIVDILSSKLQAGKSSAIFNCSGLKVAESFELRKKGRLENIEIISTKKTLLKRALENQGITDVDVKNLEGSLAVAISPDDEVAAAKLVKEFSKVQKSVTLEAGLLEGKWMDAVAIKQLADLPSKMELLSKMVGSMKAPVSGFVNVLSGNLRGLVQVLNSIKESK